MMLITGIDVCIICWELLIIPKNMHVKANNNDYLPQILVVQSIKLNFKSFGC